MKRASFANLFVLAIALSVAAVGCHKRPTALTNIPGRTGEKVPELPPGPPINPNEQPNNPDFVGYPTGPGHPGWNKDPGKFAANTVHFDFDSAAVKTTEKPKAAAVADYLESHPTEAVEIEGHCDERGTEEYNRSLGERRALALREELITRGIDPARVDTISYGEDKPVDPGHNEEAWQQNRRGVFVLLTPPK